MLLWRGIVLIVNAVDVVLWRCGWCCSEEEYGGRVGVLAVVDKIVRSHELIVRCARQLERACLLDASFLPGSFADSSTG
jgi:hypothetical protein